MGRGTSFAGASSVESTGAFVRERIVLKLSSRGLVSPSVGPTLLRGGEERKLAPISCAAVEAVGVGRGLAMAAVDARRLRPCVV